ncbi:MAG: DNA polymerase III subunit delta [Planctomycetaceae bacterium]|nr:DNA polymerase III subunit delta [Planctomycetaceae bacterium]MBQ2822517.1 DNA polymerase III subunit delta [Thermoguttaceae bacterium]
MAKKSVSWSENHLPALQWLEQPEKHIPGTICAVYGEESFLRRQVLGKLPEVFANALRGEVGTLEGGFDDFDPAQFDAGTISWKRVLEEVSTFSMFGPSRRLVILNDADDFISKNRDLLEKYAESPVETGVLVLELKSFPSNTRLFKLVEGNGLLIDCQPLNEHNELPRWICETAVKKHHLKIQPQTASLLVSQVGAEMGLLDQELAKLALLVEDGESITEIHIRQSSGSWRTQTVWTLVDCVLDGQAKEALQYLGQLLDSGEAPIAILAQIASSMRRLAAATRLILEDERMGRKPNVDNALTAAGVNRYFLQKTSFQLRRLGRERGKKLLDWMLELDFALKGESTLPDRLLLERFILRLAMPRSQRK